MKNARALLIAVSVVICAILLFAKLAEAEGRGGGNFGGGGFHGGSINNPGPVNGRYGYPYGYGGGYLNYGGVTNPTPETSNPLGSGGGDTYQVYGAREPAAPGGATAPPAQTKPKGTVDAGDALDQGGPGDPLTGHLNDNWWEYGGSEATAAPGIAIGTTVASVPVGSENGYIASQRYYYWEGVFYTSAASGYEVIAPPIGATVSTIPGRSQLETVGGQQYFDLDGVYYQAFYSGSGLVYKVTEDPQS